MGHDRFTANKYSTVYGHKSRRQAGWARTRLRAEALQRAGTSHVIIYHDHVGYFLSPLDFLKECLTFFLFNAAFKRFVFFRLFILSSLYLSLRVPKAASGERFLNPRTTDHSPPSTFDHYLTNQIPETISAVPMILWRVTPSLRTNTLRRAVTKG